MEEVLICSPILGSHWTREMKRKSERPPDPHLMDGVHPLPTDFEALPAGVSLRGFPPTPSVTIVTKDSNLSPTMEQGILP